jgi:hypothetical protein
MNSHEEALHEATKHEATVNEANEFHDSSLFQFEFFLQTVSTS